MNLAKFKGKKILVLGLGREGLDSLRFLVKFAKCKTLGVADRLGIDKLAPQTARFVARHKISAHLGPDYLTAIKDYDIIVKTPGVPIHLPEIEAAYKKNKITSQTEIFFENYPGTIIGITGTKGKSTTAAIIHKIITSAGKKAVLAGNIGQPVLSNLARATKNDHFVYELSAHQLYRLKISPHIAVLTNIYPEHLDYYRDYIEYREAKANIAIHQSKQDYFIYNSQNKESLAIARRTKAKKIAYNEYKWEFSGRTKLIGNFNQQNLKIGAIVANILGIDQKTINRAIPGFKPLPHRLEMIGTFNGIKFYNDSLSTIQESTVAAIEALGGEVTTLIAGGFDRNQPFDKLAQSILVGNIQTLILFPTTGQRIWDELVLQAKNAPDLARLERINHFFIKTMDDAVGLALKHTMPGQICLMSAASSSFSIFRDYAQRGEAFKSSLLKFSKE